MPLYEYECDACGQRFELIQKFSDAPAQFCTACGKGPVRRLLSSPAIQFKGSGWYITDYSQKGKSDSASASGGKSDAAETKGETKKETKTEKTSDKKAEAKSDTPKATR
jgi:putative FmdB family regulatory protein